MRKRLFFKGFYQAFIPLPKEREPHSTAFENVVSPALKPTLLLVPRRVFAVPPVERSTPARILRALRSPLSLTGPADRMTGYWNAAKIAAA